MKYRFFFFVFLFGLFFLINIQHCNAAALNLVISPLPINLIASPDSTVSAQLKIKNGGTENETLHVDLMKFNAYNEDGQPRLLERGNGDDYFDWMTFSDNDFTLLPGEWKTVTATINIPPTAAFGYYYAVTFSRKEEEFSDNKTTKIEGAVSVLVLLNVSSPNAVSNIEVTEFQSDKKVYEFLPTKFLVKLKNKGNIHIAPRGNIFIDQGKKTDIAILDINAIQGNILPGSTRVFDTNWSDGFPVYVERIENNKVMMDKNGNSIFNLNWDLNKLSKFRFGKYTAHMLLVYDNGTKDIPIEATTSFWIIPWRIIGGLIVVLSLISIGVWNILRPVFKKINLKKSKR